MLTVNEPWLMHGDCLELMREIPDGSVDMILCDLPYGTTACKWDSVIPFEPLWEQYKRVIKRNGAVVLTGAEPFSSLLRTSNLPQYKYDWVWDKVGVVGFANAKIMPLRNVESVSVFYGTTPTYNPQGLVPFRSSRTNGVTHLASNSTSKRARSDAGLAALNGGRFKSDVYVQEWTNYPKQVLRFPRETGLHPTQKPVALMEYLIRTYTNEGETVLDNCMGSGTTGVACANTGRKFIGIEKDDKYFQIASERIRAAQPEAIFAD